jgi:hypothetical protein
VSKINARYEEYVGRVKSSSDIEVGKMSPYGTPSRERNTDDCVVGGGEEEHGARTYRMWNNDP